MKRTYNEETSINKSLIFLSSFSLVILILTACSSFNSTQTKPASGQSSASTEAFPTAIYNPQPSETPMTELWDHAQSVCEGKPLYQWREAGTFTWNFSYPGYNEVSTVAQPEAVYSLPSDSTCGWLTVGLGEIMKDAPAEGATFQWSGSCQTTGAGSTKTIVQGIKTTVSGWEQKTTRLGTFDALRVKSLNQYVDGTTPGIVEVNDWYVCGYGRIYSEANDTSTDTRYVDELVSFTPQSTDESRVRFILADMQLMNTSDPYRTEITDEEIAESLRRWDAGIRVANIEQFERKNMDGKWQIVYAGSDKPIQGTDVNLTSDLQ